MNFYFGLVRDNVDPLGIGRCKVKVCGLYDSLLDSDLPWLQMIHPTGIINPPDIGDQVIVLALDEHCQYLIVIGRVPGINEDNTPDNNSRSISRYPDSRVLQTSSGHVIEISDKNGAEFIEIQHNSGSKITFETNGDITLDSSTVQTTHTLKAGNGVSGTFSTTTGTVTVEDGIITSIL